ncbi:nuclear transport factor 2 family protein [Telmatospirillum sp.]|uniref:nuclear transport factor 2 family protein n=1 Tax=Telmatospirillum sp. TaxID=2079197 RepID=UPI002852B7F4|nr:nuclear transport factor 2 family protein [Telmatospirillum sp.]
MKQSVETPNGAQAQPEISGENGMPRETYTAYAGAEPYFELIRNALGDLVDGEHFFDIIADDIAYEVRYDLGWPRLTRGRADLMAQFKGYVDAIRLLSADRLFVTKADTGRVVVIEYDVHGKILATGADYQNRFCSIIELEDRKIARWRDYMDSHAAWNALTASAG